jgi:hypothetical protein
MLSGPGAIRDVTAPSTIDVMRRRFATVLLLVATVAVVAALAACGDLAGTPGL